MSEKNCLVICRSLRDLSIIDRIGNVSCEIVVASNSLDVQDMAGKDARVSHVTFIDQMKSLVDVIDDVLDIRKKVNKWLREQSRGTPDYLLEWIKHAEGDMTTQKILDVILLINSYIQIFVQYKIETFFLRRQIQSYWEDEILIQTAESYGVNVIEYKPLQSMVFRLFNLEAVTRQIFGRERTFYVPENIKFKVKRCFFWWRVLKSHFDETQNRINKDSQKAVAFLLGSSDDKHVDNTTIVMQEINKRDGYSSIALCWKADIGRKKVNEKGLFAVNLESWFPLKRTFKLIQQYSKIKRSINSNLSSFQNSNLIEYKKISLGGLLTKSMKFFLEDELFSRLVLDHAAENYFSHTHPVAMKTWGRNIFDLGRICSESLKGVSTQKGCDRFIFFYSVGLDTGIRFGEMTEADELDLFFVHGEIDKQEYEKMPAKTEIVIAGYPRDSFIHEFINIPKSKSLTALGIFNYNKHIVFYVTSGFTRGYLSVAEYILLSEGIIQFAKNNKNITLIIKPHPSEPTMHIHQIYKKHGSPENVILLAKSAPIYHCINISDIIVIKYSTVGFEAMKLGKPVISIVLDGEKRFQDIYGDGVEKFQDIESFIHFMNNITSNDEQFENWLEHRIMKQNEFLPKKMFMPEEPVEKIIVDNVIERVEERANNR